jgi:hypothetical protein
MDTAVPPHALLWDLAAIGAVSRCLHAVAGHGIADALARASPAGLTGSPRAYTELEATWSSQAARTASASSATRWSHPSTSVGVTRSLHSPADPTPRNAAVPRTVPRVALGTTSSARARIASRVSNAACSSATEAVQLAGCLRRWVSRSGSVRRVVADGFAHSCWVPRARRTACRANVTTSSSARSAPWVTWVSKSSWPNRWSRVVAVSCIIAESAP